MFISIGQVSKLAGVSKSTLRRWEKDEYLLADYRTKGNHRRYLYKKIMNFLGLSKDKSEKEVFIYAREVLAVRKFTGKDVRLQKVPAYNSSRIHVDCGGSLKRDISKNQYDIAPCNRCNKMVNTHKNAAIYLVRSTNS